MPHADPIARAACQKEAKLKTIKRRKDMLSVYPCRACNSNDSTVIQWHHVEPNTKSLDIWRTAWAEDKFWDEILKCIPLCANCHVKIHQNLLCLMKT